MSDDLIRREDAIKALYKYSFVSKDVIEREINAIPSADRPQGEWTQNVLRPDIHRYECSNCKAHHIARYDYCPSCGARMKGADDED